MRTLRALAAACIAAAPALSAPADDPPCRVIGVAVEADYEFTLAHFAGDGAAAEGYIATLVESISSIFESGLNVSLELTFVHARSEPGGPYTSNDAATLLAQFRSHWLGNMGHVERDTAILLTGRTLQGGVTEFQYLDALCNNNSFSLLSAMAGDFPMPLTSETAGNEDPIRLTRTIGRSISARALRTLDPDLDPCWPGCAPPGSIFTSCETCPGGTANIRLEFDHINIGRMLAFLDEAPCDLGCACPADLNGDGAVDTLDFLMFLNLWASGDDRADWNSDGNIDTLDFLAFLNDWVAGCD